MTQVNERNLDKITEGYSNDEQVLIDRFVESQLQQGKVTIWSEGSKNIHNGKSTCKVKEILEKYSIQYEEINVNDTPWSDSIKLGLSMHTGYHNFPNVYFGKEHVGGLDDLQPMIFNGDGAFKDVLVRNGILQDD